MCICELKDIIHDLGTFRNAYEHLNLKKMASRISAGSSVEICKDIGREEGVITRRMIQRLLIVFIVLIIVVDKRLESRVDKMLESGLIAELDAFHHLHNSPILSADSSNNHNKYTRGVFQCIGFKEFHDYLMLNHDDRESPLGQNLLQQGTLACRSPIIVIPPELVSMEPD